MTRRELFARIAGAALAAFPAVLRTKVDEKVVALDTETWVGADPSPRPLPWSAYLFDELGCVKISSIDYVSPTAVIPVWMGGGRYETTRFTLTRAYPDRRVALYRYKDGPRFWETAG